jgi:HSP20 family protein
MNRFRELEEMEKRLSTIFGRSSLRPEGEKEAMTMAEWSPLVDITEDEKEYLIKAEVPDVKKEDVKLTVQDNVLTISGERKVEKAVNRAELVRMSRPPAASNWSRRWAMMPEWRETVVL